MDTEDPAGQARKGLFDSIAGKAKEMFGAVSNNDSLTTEGQLQQRQAQEHKEANSTQAVAPSSNVARRPLPPNPGSSSTRMRRYARPPLSAPSTKRTPRKKSAQADGTHARAVQESSQVEQAAEQARQEAEALTRKEGLE